MTMLLMAFIVTTVLVALAIAGFVLIRHRHEAAHDAPLAEDRSSELVREALAAIGEGDVHAIAQMVQVRSGQRPPLGTLSVVLSRLVDTGQARSRIVADARYPQGKPVYRLAETERG